MLATEQNAISVRTTLSLEFDGHAVRFVGTAERPEWIAADVCEVLGVANVSRALADFDDDEKGIRILHTLGGKQSLLTVYEAGLYRLMLGKAKSPNAVKFRKWICGEVIPSIRRHGCYPPPAIVKPTLEAYKRRIADGRGVRKNVPAGFWCVLLEGADILIDADSVFASVGLSQHEYDLLDGSIGTMWASFRADQPWAGEAKRFDYTFPPGDPRGTVQPWCYPMPELGHFKMWLHGTYIVQHMPAYIRRKYKADGLRKALPALAAMGMLPEGERAKLA